MPETISGLVFDLDNTLYTNAAYTAYQNEVLEARLAVQLGMDRPTLASTLDCLRSERRAAGMGATSMANLSLALGVDIATSVRWREECIRPAEWLSPDPSLAEALGTLAARYPLALVTNNPRSVGIASLEALGVASCFGIVVGLDDSLRSKPDPEPFILAAGRLAIRSGARTSGGGSVFSGLVSIGDRPDVDLVPAMALGMGAVLVERVSEVYSLPQLFASG